MSTAARRSSRPYSSTDTTADKPSSSSNRSNVPWDGSQTRQASWFNLKLKVAEANYDFRTLYETSTVVLAKSGLIAVYSVDHAYEHAQGGNKGTIRKLGLGSSSATRG